MKLSNKLENNDLYPFHMPGHKRNPKFGIPCANIDITEIDGFDNLHNPTGLILDIENRLTKLYKSQKSFMMVNGSTVGILSAIFALCDDYDTIIVARNCHKSVFNACMLRHLNIVFIEPEFDYTNGYYTQIKQETVDNAIKCNLNAKAVVITSPTYEGIISNIKSSIPMLVDSAHGAHLINNYANGDIVISSLHKTLPALTQTAVANIYSKEFISKFKLYLDIFETSSPSYVLMSSVEKCLNFIENNDFSIIPFSAELDNLVIKPTDDIGKIIVSTANTNISGTELADILRNEYKIEVEMASLNYVILMETVGDDENAIKMLQNALENIDKKLHKTESNPVDIPFCTSDNLVIEISDGIETEIENSVGKTSNEFIFAYPPDIPILFPNELITTETVNYIKKSISNGVNLISDSGLLPNKILTKCK